MFVGRAAELEQLRRAIASDRAELGVVYGRRRVGKSTLLEEAAPPSGSLLFEGLEQGGLRAQVEHFADQLAQQTRSVPVRARTWKEAFDALTPQLARGRRYVVFDEFPWMASGQTQLVSLLKYYWDRVWKKNPRLTLVLCGSVASFMVEHVLHSSALHNRKTFELKVDPLPAHEARQFFKGLRGEVEAAKFLMLLGSVPKYLEQVDPRESLAANMDRLCFTKNGFFVNELETVFKEQFKVVRTYEAIVGLLARGGRSREQLAAGLGKVPGGGLGRYLENLERADFVKTFAPLAIDHGTGSKTRRHVLWDEWLRFYFTYMRPNLAAIRANTARGLFDSLTASSLESYFGLAFERLCMKNIEALLTGLGIAPHETLGYGPFFRQRARKSTAEGVQIDILIRRRGDVLTLVECKFTSSAVDTSVIREVERKVALLAAPRRFTVERVLISANGVTPALQQRGYFHRTLGLDWLMSPGPR